MIQKGILDLPNEVLISIFELKNPQTGDYHRDVIPNLRLTCRRFCVLSSHLLLRTVTVDISRPDTLTRLQSIAADRNIARGVREVYIRLHFYHHWVAASQENFMEAVVSEWLQRTSYMHDYIRPEKGVLGIDQIALQDNDDNRDQNGGDTLAKNDKTSSSESESLRSQLVCSEAYKLYQTRFQAQDQMMRKTDFATTLAESLSKLVNFTNLVFHDGAVNNNYGPGATVLLDVHDYLGQEEALVRVFSRPMIWEDVRWIQPLRDYWDAVPLNLLVDIPLAIGARKDIYINYLSFHVSAAPSYASFPSDQTILASLSAAIDHMAVFQLIFQPCCRSSCGPWLDNNNENHTSVSLLSRADFQSLDRYIGALLNSSNLGYIKIDLSEFYTSAGFNSDLDFPDPDPLGDYWYFNPQAEIWSICLRQVPTTSRVVQKLAAALCDDEDADLGLHYITLREGTWRETLDVLQAKKGGPKITIGYPVYDGRGTFFAD
ncbi:hypothetical protein TSTA_019310 [Talaromyces stipitatus ATCC 10500]|uniref:Uncharacterized protein n=1 Tax=Talaromyces stipitatus (strain ATCC 10500 / CBS 375.48 / QM 6759 / NRRL 1006) TaxID=441959 RepID=B8MH54_TALSN|nr:uncharacterized protein TSTA_019310 [Talaromyces stipitatus ATCC 10500]EED16868.1 hypothetical protein TSTA_019310 [Talaromyces stipitatus ATCC 10500]